MAAACENRTWQGWEVYRAYAACPGDLRLGTDLLVRRGGWGAVRTVQWLRRPPPCLRTESSPHCFKGRSRGAKRATLGIYRIYRRAPAASGS